MAGATTTVTAEFLGTENVARQMNVLGRAGAQFSSDLTSKLGKMFGAVAIGTMAFSKMEQSISKNMATAKQVSSLAIKFNVDPSQVHSMKIAADDAGVSIRSLMMASKQFGKVAGEALSNKDAANNMKQLGINAEKLAEMQAKPMKFLPEAAVALAGIADENERAAAGAFLFGRQYQQISPLLEKLGSDEEARGEFLSNNNAMTNEQIKANKESARIQSQMSEGWDKFMASATPVLNWAMQFANYMASALSSVLGIIANQDKLKKAKEEQTAGQSVIKVESHMTNMAHRIDKTREKVTKGTALGLSDKEVGISEEERAEYDKVYAAGGLEKYMSTQFGLAHTAGRETKRVVDNMSAGAYASAGHGYMPAAQHDNRVTASGEGVKAQAAVDKDFVKAIGGEYALGHLDPKEAARIQRKLKISQALSGAPTQGLIGLNGMTTDPETGERNYKNPLAGVGAAILTSGQKKEEAVYEGQKSSAISAKRSAARMFGREYDAKTDREMSSEEYAELMRARAADEKSGKVGTFVESKAASAQKKKEKAQTRAFEKSERHLNETGRSPLEKAQGGLEDVRGDMLPIQEDIVEKLDEEKDAQSRLIANAAKLKGLADKEATAKENGEKFVAIARAEAAKAGEELNKEEEDAIRDKFKLTADETEKIAQLNGAIKGDEKLLAKTQGERIELQTKLNGLKAQEGAAIDAVAKAAEAQWAKERGLAKDAHDDDQAYEREMQELKYKNMKNSGKTQLDILKEKYNFELKRYGEASEEKDTLDAEIAAKQKKRADEAAAAVIEAQEFGDDEEKTAEAAAAAAEKAGKMTDEEVAATKQAREKKDKGRQDLEKAVYDFDQFKPQAVVSDLGKMGGGAAVQFGNNPIDEIRKSNSFLKAIEKNTSTANIKQVQTFGDKAALADSLDEGLFGEEVPM